MKYTTEDFERTLRDYDPYDLNYAHRKIVEAALRIAANVMRPGTMVCVSSADWSSYLTTLRRDDSESEYDSPALSS